MVSIYEPRVPWNVQGDKEGIDAFLSGLCENICTAYSLAGPCAAVTAMKFAVPLSALLCAGLITACVGAGLAQQDRSSSSVFRSGALSLALRIPLALSATQGRVGSVASARCHGFTPCHWTDASVMHPLQEMMANLECLSYYEEVLSLARDGPEETAAASSAEPPPWALPGPGTQWLYMGHQFFA